MPEPAPALRLGDHVHYDGQTWQLAAVNGVWLTLRGSSMQSCAVLLTQLVGAPDFAVLDGTTPAVPAVSTALAALEPAELERLRRLEAHVAQIDTAAADQDPAPDPRYDHRATTLEQRVAAKAAELAGSDMPVGRSQLFRLLATDMCPTPSPWSPTTATGSGHNAGACGAHPGSPRTGSPAPARGRRTGRYPALAGEAG